MLAQLSVLALATLSIAAPVSNTVIAAVSAAVALPNTTQTTSVAYYWQNGNAGACGLYSQDTDLVVGLPLSFYNDTGSVSPYCGTYLVVKNLANNLTVTARVADASATQNLISLSVGTWRALNGDGSDFTSAAWRFANLNETAAAKAALASAALVPTTASSTPAATQAVTTEAAPTTTSSTYVAPTTTKATSTYVAPTTTKATSTYVAPTTTWTPTSTYVAPTTTWKPTTTTYAAVQAAATTKAASNSGTYSGTATYFYQNGVAGACGSVHSDSDYVVAIDSDMWNGGGYCGKTVVISANGKTISAVVADMCPTCVSSGSLDLSVGAFTGLASTSAGVASISWSFA